MKHQKWIFLLVALWAGLCIYCAAKPQTDISESERRKLAKFPSVTTEGLLSGSFMEQFETYSLDQFPLRDSFRSVKALFARYLLGEGDVNGIYVEDGYLEKLSYPLNESSVTSAADKFASLSETYFPDSPVYYAVVPDKNYYLAAQNGYPALDYDRLFALLRENLPFATEISLTDTLSLSDFYKTDSHWRQEALVPTAQKLAEALGVTLSGSYETVEARPDFLGVYAGQSALPLSAEPLNYLTNDTLEGCTVYNVETGEETGLYNFDKLYSRDPYEFFLSGASAILYVENPNAASDRELVVFRDSYGSSLLPLLAEGYSKITVVDIRYVQSSLLSQYVDFHGQDILFLYGTQLLNASAVLR